MWVISSSCGNDSVALIQWAIESKIKDVVVTYIDTGWAPVFSGRLHDLVICVLKLGINYDN